MPAISAERKQFLHDVFVTALEGGIGYWSQASKYHWSVDADGEQEDLDGFVAIIHEWDEDANDYGSKKLTVNRQVIQSGIRALADKSFQVRDDIRKTVLAASAMNDSGDIDAEIADVIVQAGLFGEVIYG